MFLVGLSEGERQLCVFDSGAPPVQRYQLIKALKLPPEKELGFDFGFLVPQLIKQAAALNADALIAYDAVVFPSIYFGLETVFVTGQAIKWHQPTSQSCQDMGGITVETMLQTNRTSSGRVVFPFRSSKQHDAIDYVPLHDSGVVMLPTIQDRTPSPEIARAAILKSLVLSPKSSWQVEKEEPGQLQLRTAWRRWEEDLSLTVTVSYDASSYEVKYFGSTGLAFKPKTRLVSVVANQKIAALVENINKAYSK